MYQIKFVYTKNNTKKEIDEDNLDTAKTILQQLVDNVPRVEKGMIYQADIIDKETGEIVESKFSKIRRLRLDMDMTQVEFSEAFLIPKRTIENWENGVAVPPSYVIKMLEVIIKNGIRLD